MLTAWLHHNQLSNILDFCQALAQGATEDRGRQRKRSVVSVLRGLSFIAIKADLPTLIKFLGTPSVSAFLTSSWVKDKQEAWPLPMASAAQFEDLIQSSSASVAEKLVIGFIWVLVWGGLKFADGQRA